MRVGRATEEEVEDEFGIIITTVLGRSSLKEIVRRLRYRS